MLVNEQPDGSYLRLAGNLDIFCADREDALDGVTERWNEIQIHGDPQGLRDLARLLLQLAEADQDGEQSLPAGARLHLHLNPGRQLSASSDLVIIGRLDAKGSGELYSRFLSRNP